MNRIPRTRLVTLMAAAAGVTAGLGSMATSAEAQARTPASAAVAADTLKSKPAAAPKKSSAVPEKPTVKGKSSPAAPAVAKKPAAPAKPVVSTAGPNAPENDVCADDPDCRNVNGGGY